MLPFGQLLLLNPYIFNYFSCKYVSFNALYLPDERRELVMSVVEWKDLLSERFGLVYYKITAILAPRNDV